MSSEAQQLKDSIRALGVEWATEYGELIKGSATDLTNFYTQVATVAAASALEDDKDALALLKVASHSILLTHRCRVQKQNRAAFQRGVSLLINVVQVFATVAGNAIVGGVANAVDALVPEE